jgi:predicted nucleotidyltransferase
MKPSAAELESELRDTLARTGLSYDAIASNAIEFIVFGSRAAGWNKPGSDWDLLIVGEPPSDSVDGIEVITLSPQELDTSAWLESELANHVASEGTWLKGSGHWRAMVRISETTIERKRAKTQTQASTFLRLRDAQGPAKKSHYAARIRRNLQRLDLLARNERIATNPELNAAWSGLDQPARKAFVTFMRARFELGPTAAWDLILEADPCSSD